MNIEFICPSHQLVATINRIKTAGVNLIPGRLQVGDDGIYTVDQQKKHHFLKGMRGRLVLALPTPPIKKPMLYVYGETGGPAKSFPLEEPDYYLIKSILKDQDAPRQHHSTPPTGKYRWRRLKRSSPHEEKARKVLKSLGIHFLEEYKLNGRYFDFVIPRAQLMLEIDSRSYHNRRKRNDSIKNLIVKRYGWRLKRIDGSQLDLIPFQIKRAINEAVAERVWTLLADHPDFRPEKKYTIDGCGFDFALRRDNALIDIIPDFRDNQPKCDKSKLALQEGWSYHLIDYREKIKPQLEQLLNTVLKKIPASEIDLTE